MWNMDRERLEAASKLQTVIGTIERSLSADPARVVSFDWTIEEYVPRTLLNQLRDLVRIELENQLKIAKIKLDLL